MRKLYVELAGKKEMLSALVRFTFRFWRRGLTVLFLLCCIIQYSNSQIVTQGAAVKANFGIDADLYTNYLMVDSGYVTPSMTDDWFENLSVYPGTGTPVFAPTQDYIDSVLAAILLDNNFGFSFRMYDFGHIPRNTKIGSVTWIDGVYARDNNATQSNTDASVFAGTKDKNADNPTTWNLGDAGTPIKDDLIEIMGHMRIDDNIDDDGDGNPDVWGIGAFTTVNSDGNAHGDFEFFAREIGYDGSSLTNTGNEGGRTAWVFDEFGNVVSAGALVVSIDFENGGTEPHASVRIWVSEDDFNTLNSKSSNPFEFIDGDFNKGLESGVYGYGGIQPLVNSNSPAVWAIVNVDSTTLGPPWGSLESSTADWVAELGELQFAEFAINLSYLGLDAFGGDACNKTLGSLMVKTRSSSEFTAELKDFAGPFVFGFDLETKIVTTDLDSCDDGENEFDLTTAVDSTGDGIVTFYSSGADAFAHTNEIASTQTLPVGDTMFWARSSNPEDSLCFVIDSFMVTVHDNPVCSVTTTDETYFNAGNGTAKVTVTGGEGPFTYLWVASNGGTIGGGQGTDSIYDLTDGRYDVYITDANGCETSCYDSLSWAPTAPTCAVFAIDVECFGAETGTVWAEVTPSDTIGYPPYTYYWFKDGTPFDTVVSNETTDTMFNMGAGIYDVEVLNAVDPNSTLCYDTIFQPDPNPVSVECAGVTIDGCQGQSAVDLDFGNWLDTAFVVTGGTDPLDTVFKVGDVVVDLDTVSAPYYCGGDVTVRMIVSDYCGLVDSCDATFSVTPDLTPPVITGVDADTTIECPSDPNWSEPSANDACFGPVQLTMTDDTSSFACPLVITRTWRAEDDCGNTSSASQTITVIDTTPPVISGVAADTTIECPDVPVFSSPQATDGCDDNVTLTSSMDTSSYACPLIVTKTWKAEDDCGNTSMASQTITVIDTTPPILVLPVGYEDYLCNDYPGDLTATFTDECSDNGSITVSPVLSGSTLCEQIYTYTFTARDDCGNTTTDSITVVREWESLEDCETAFARLPEDLPAPSSPYDSKTNPDPYSGTDAIGARCFIDDVFERWGWVNRVKKDSTYYLPVYAGAGQCDVTKGDSVGTVTLAFYGDTVTVMFDLIDPWVMTEAHIYVGEDMYPTFKNGKHKDEATVAPGQYNLVYENGDPLTDLKVGYYNAPEYVYVIVHAVTCRPLCYCDQTIYQGFDAGLYSLVQTRGNKNKGAVTTDVNNFVNGELKVFPNPFTEKVTFEFVSATDSYGTLDIYSVTGQHVARILDRPVLSGELNRISYEPDHDVSGIYIYRLKLDDNVQVGRIIYKE